MADSADSVVTLKDLWDEQRRQSDRLADALGAVERTLERLGGHLDAIDAFTAAAKDVHADHESRLRSLERWRYGWPASVLVAVASAAAAIVAALHAAH